MAQKIVKQILIVRKLCKILIYCCDYDYNTSIDIDCSICDGLGFCVKIYYYHHFDV